MTATQVGMSLRARAREAALDVELERASDAAAEGEKTFEEGAAAIRKYLLPALDLTADDIVIRRDGNTAIVSVDDLTFRYWIGCDTEHSTRRHTIELARKCERCDDRVWVEVHQDWLSTYREEQRMDAETVLVSLDRLLQEGRTFVHTSEYDECTQRHRAERRPEPPTLTEKLKEVLRDIVREEMASQGVGL